MSAKNDNIKFSIHNNIIDKGNKVVKIKESQRQNRFKSQEKRYATTDHPPNLSKENKLPKSVKNKSSLNMTYCPRVYDGKTLKKVISN